MFSVQVQVIAKHRIIVVVMDAKESKIQLVLLLGLAVLLAFLVTTKQ